MRQGKQNTRFMIMTFLSVQSSEQCNIRESLTSKTVMNRESLTSKSPVNRAISRYRRTRQLPRAPTATWGPIVV